MYLLWSLLFFQPAMGNAANMPAHRVDVRSVHPTALCDVQQIVRSRLRVFADLARGLEEAHQRLHVRIEVERVAGPTWNLDLFLLSPRRPGVSWRLSAPSCVLAARRAATKLRGLARSLARPILVSAQPPVAEVVAAEIMQATPEIQRPRAHVQAPPTPTPAFAVLAAGPVSRREPAATELVVAPMATEPLAASTVGAPGRFERPDAGTLRLRAEARVAHGVLPQPIAAGARVIIAAIGRRVRTEFGGTFDVGGEFSLPGETRVHHPIRVAVRGSMCGDVVWRRLELHACVGVDAGLIAIKSTDASAKAWTLHLHASPGLTWWVQPRLGLFAGLGAGPALTRANFFVGSRAGMGAQSTHVMPPAFLEAALGLEVRLPGAERHRAARAMTNPTPDVNRRMRTEP